jgi:hypothetical protein
MFKSSSRDTVPLSAATLLWMVHFTYTHFAVHNIHRRLSLSSNSRKLHQHTPAYENTVYDVPLRGKLSLEGGVIVEAILPFTRAYTKS